ncbi:ABC transporter substrate-binding protein [Paenibacillus sp. GCM10027626]|uniref:ABC transporter substrate-binding protein n=1 Tax=Paenibacillus sp. GCM10027626 TaxID=3273411 RepID=UPI00362E2C46
MKRPGIIAIVLLAVLALTACTSDKPSTGSGKKVLKIAVDSKGSYDYLYRDYIDAAFPDTEIELIELWPDYKVPVSNEEYAEKVKQEKADLIFTWTERYTYLAREGILTDLSARMSGSGMKEEEFYPGMLEWLKGHGDGVLYGLSNQFNSSVLYYNEDLFEKYGVEPPHDGMTLAEIYQLGDRFRTAGGGSEGIVGYYEQFIDQPYAMLQTFATSEGLRMIDFSRGQVAMDTPLWRSTMETMINLYKNDTLSMHETKSEMIDGEKTFTKEAMEAGDLFGQGKAAMTKMRYSSAEGSKYPFKTGYAVAPVSSSDPTRSGDIDIYRIMAIPNAADNPDLAWDVIRFMSSDHLAKVFASLGNEDGFSTHSSQLRYTSDPVITRIFELMPIVLPDSEAVDQWDLATFYKPFEDVVNRELKEAITDNKPLDDVIAAIQKDGQAILDKAKR